MPEKSSSVRVVIRNSQPAMTFDEIARQLGMSRACAQECYRRGIQKLRRLARRDLVPLFEAADAQRQVIDRIADFKGFEDE